MKKIRQKLEEKIWVRCKNFEMITLTFKGSDEGLPKFSFFGSRLVATNHFEMIFKHFESCDLLLRLLQ